MDIYNAVKDFAGRRGLSFGICGAEEFSEARAHLESADTPFVTKDINKRVNPSMHLKNAGSAVVVGLKQVSLKKIIESDADENEPSGIISSLGAYEDYHSVIKKHLAEMAEYLLKRISFKYKIFVDGGALNERALAVRAGLGFAAPNGCVISRELGAFWYVGCLLTDLKIDFKRSDTIHACPDGCEICAGACPPGAIKKINGEHRVEARECISYLTQKDGPLSQSEKINLNGQLYGCDVCRRVCPLNKPEDVPPETRLNLKNLVGIDEAKFAERFGKTAMGWRGFEILRRNANALHENNSLNRRAAD